MIVNFEEAPFRAFIMVSYPSGTCTVTHKESGKSYSHSGGGEHTFMVNKKGEWEVVASDGSSTDSGVVNVDKRGDAFKVRLSYRYYLFNNGLVNSISWTGSSGTYSSYTIGSTIEVTRNGQSYNEWADTWATSAVNLTNYNKLCVNVTARSGSYLSFGVATKQDAELEDLIAIKSVDETGVCELDISTINTSLYIYVVADYLMAQQVSGSMTVSQVWLE